MSLMVPTSTNVCVGTCEQCANMAPVSSPFSLSLLFLCVLTVGGQEVHASITSSSQPPVTRRHCHVEAVLFLWIVFFLSFFCCPWFLGQNTHAHTRMHTSAHQLPQQSVFSVNCGQQSVWRWLPCVKFALSCRSEDWLVLERLNSWIRRLSPCWNKSV